MPSLMHEILLVFIKAQSEVFQSKYEQFSDEELVSEILDTNNVLLYGLIYDRFNNQVYNKCLGFVKDKDLAKDLTQEIFIKAYTKLKGFEGRSNFATWLYALSYNQCLDRKLEDIKDSCESLVEKVGHI